MPLSTLTSKGQITLPKEIRDSLNLHTGDRIEFIMKQGSEVLLRPITKKVDDVFGRLYQPGRKAVSIKEMDAAIQQKIKARK